jgi:hypothetical protein
VKNSLDWKTWALLAIAIVSGILAVFLGAAMWYVGFTYGFEAYMKFRIYAGLIACTVALIGIFGFALWQRYVTPRKKKQPPPLRHGPEFIFTNDQGTLIKARPMLDEQQVVKAWDIQGFGYLHPSMRRRFEDELQYWMTGCTYTQFLETLLETDFSNPINLGRLKNTKPEVR